jgi:hypothetical protein
MNTVADRARQNAPTKRSSALFALLPALALEVICIMLGVGGAVSIVLAYVIAFGAVHQFRLRR